jgi:hypothetical protein
VNDCCYHAFNHSRSEYFYFHVHTPCHEYTADLYFRASLYIQGFAVRRPPVGYAIRTVSDDTRCPPETGDKMVMDIFEHSNALAFLTQVPAAKNFIIGHRDKESAARMENKGSYPIVMTYQNLDTNSTRIPDPDLFISRSGRHELCRTVYRGCSFQAGQCKQVLICSRWCQSTAFLILKSASRSQQMFKIR